MAGKQHNGGKAVATPEKAKAQRLDMGQLVVVAAYAKTFSSGKRGFFGKVMDPRTGQRYQVIGAVELAS